MLVTGDELELELLKLDPLDPWLRKPPLDDDDDVDDVDDALDVVAVWVVVAVVRAVARWLPMVTPNALKPNMAMTATPRFVRPAMRSASAFERLCTAGGTGGLAGAAGCWDGGGGSRRASSTGCCI